MNARARSNRSVRIPRVAASLLAGGVRARASSRLLVALVLCVATPGCTDPAKPKQTADPAEQLKQPVGLSNTDPCAMRMHDICGALLLYYFQHAELPERLQDLTALPGLDAPLEFTCPESKQPYIYESRGIAIPERKSFVIVYDPAPSHSGMRWAILIEQPVPGEPLVTKVIPLAERFFIMKPARR